jgi:hypothetical protein
MYETLKNEYNRLKNNIFEVYDLYQRTENVSKVSAQAHPESQVPTACPEAKSGDEVTIDDVKYVIGRIYEAPTVKVVTEKPKRRRRNRRKAKKVEATPVMENKGKSVVTEKKVEKPVAKPLAESKPKISDIQRSCFICGSKTHLSFSCDKKPIGWKQYSKQIWESMSPAEKAETALFNRNLLKKPVTKKQQSAKQPEKKVVQQSASMHEPVRGNMPLHDNQIPIYYPKANNSACPNHDFWGTMDRVTFDKVNYVVITEHQLLKEVYYCPEEGKFELLPPKDKWETFGKGTISYCRIPVNSLKAMKRPGQAVSVSAPQIGVDIPCMYFGLNPRTMERELCATVYSWDGRETSDIIHSATSANFSCGSMLYDSKLKAIVGLHHGSLGPDAKHGNNNLCSPLKVMGLRQ